MTQEEIRKSTKKKVQIIENMMKQLGLTVSAEQVITDGGFIKLVVYYNDTEQYERDEPKENKEVKLQKKMKKVTPKENED